MRRDCRHLVPEFDEPEWSPTPPSADVDHIAVRAVTPKLGECPVCDGYKPSDRRVLAHG